MSIETGSNEEENAVLQLGVHTDGRAEDATGALGNVEHVAAVSTADLTDKTLRDQVEALIADGATAIDLDTTKLDGVDEILDDLPALQAELERRGVELRVVGLASADLQNVEAAMSGNDVAVSKENMSGEYSGLAA